MARSSPSRLPAALVVLVVLAVLYAIGSSSSGSPGPSPGPATATAASAGDSLGASTLPGSSAGVVATAPAATPAATHARATPSARTAGACRPTDQIRYVYHPWRLQVVSQCVRVWGTVEAVRREADGDLHILLALDAPYRSLLRPANQGEELGDLVVEPMCVGSVSQSDAVAVCRADPDPLPYRFPAVGDHVWMEGRYVLDLDHNGWAELHPLYRWGR